MDEPTVTDSGILKPINNKPLTLQSLCCKTILMQEENHPQSSEYHEIKVHCKTSEEINQNSALKLNLIPDSFGQNFYFTSEMGTSDVHEYVNLSNTREWMDFEEFDSFIHQLKAENNDNDPLPNLENCIPQFVVRRNPLFYNEDVKTKTFCGDDFEINSFKEKVQPKNMKNDAQITDDKSLIILNSSEGSDFEINLPDDIDSISLSSIEAYVQNIQNKSSKVTIEISPQVEYFTNFHTANTSKDTKQVPSIKESVKKTQLKSSSITSKGKAESLDKHSIISLSSDDENPNDSYCSGYNSSDFEFITEEEASDGLIINFRKTNETNKTVEITASNAANQFSQMPNTWHPNNNCEDYRQNHQIPEGENYFDLFRGIYTPTVPFMYENKRMGMVNEYRGIGFDIGVLSRQISEYQQESDEYKQEADDCAKKILNMYPRENRKRRRRFY